MEKRKTFILWSVDKQSCVTFSKNIVCNGMICITLTILKNQFYILRNVSVTETEDKLMTSLFKRFLADGSSCFEFENGTKNFGLKLYKNYSGDYCINICCVENQFEFGINLKVDVNSISTFLEQCNYDEDIHNSIDTVSEDDTKVVLSFDTLKIASSNDLWEVHMSIMVKDYFIIKENILLSKKNDFDVLSEGISKLLLYNCMLEYQASCTPYCIRLRKTEFNEKYRIEIESIKNSEGDYISYIGTIEREEVKKLYSELGNHDDRINKETNRYKSFSDILSRMSNLIKA